MHPNLLANQLLPKFAEVMLFCKLVPNREGSLFVNYVSSGVPRVGISGYCIS